MKTAEFLIEAQQIVTGKHSAYLNGSDRIANFESFCRMFAMDFPNEATVIANDIASNIGASVEVSNMTEYRAGVTASILKKTAAMYV
jgi:hypothetical protein